MAAGSGGDDRVTGGGGEDRLAGGRGRDSLAGGRGDDALSGGGRDAIDGGTCRDTLDGGRGNDTLAGGDGEDTFAFGPRAGRDVIADLDPSRDRINFTALGTRFEDLAIAPHGGGADTRIVHDGGVILLPDVAPGEVEEDLFLF